MKRAAAIVVLMLATAASARVPDVYGPPPDWDRYKALGEAAARAKLPDPDNWQVEWPNGYIKDGWRHRGRFPGYLSCGMLRAATPVQGRAVIRFVVVIDYDAVQTIDLSDRHSNSLVNVMCDFLVAHGKLPPAKLMEQPAELTAAAIGVTVRAMPEGAYVISVVPGSPAQRAGLVPGTVITRVNGIALSGLGTAMVKVLESDTPKLELETAAGGHLVVQRDP